MTARALESAECWNCREPAAALRIVRETILRGRPRSEGGPYRVFRCRACGSENGVLAGPEGGILLHPLSGLEAPSVLDRLLSCGERRRLTASRVWWQRNRARVERFRRGIAEPRPRRGVGARPGTSPLDAARAAGDAARDALSAPRRPARRRASSGPRGVLGVFEDATLAEVRRAFRRLAKAHHPDRAGPGAADRFREIRAAYETLVAELG